MALDIGHTAFEREVRRARVEGRPVPPVAIVGGGLSGLATAIQLARSGVRTFTVLEQSDGVGGTWRDNVYPGAACDVPSHLYSFSFAPKTDWSRRFAEQPEILDYAEDLVERFHLGPHLRIGTTVTVGPLRRGRRHLATSTSATPRTATTSSRPTPWCSPAASSTVPTCPTSRAWTTSPGRRGTRPGGTTRSTSAASGVAVVGIGGQRHPVRPPGGGGGRVHHRLPAQPQLRRAEEGPPLPRRPPDGPCAGSGRCARPTAGGSTGPSRCAGSRSAGTAGPAAQLQELFRKGIRDDVVYDRLPEQAVVPDYPIGCKRILISNDWYPALLRPDVTVVDSPVARIEPDAVVTDDGTRHPADVAHLRHGLRRPPTSCPTSRSPASAAGRWPTPGPRGAHAYLGTAVAGFPNCYLLYGPNTNLGHNSILFMVERQLNLVLQALALQIRSADRHGRRRGGGAPGAYLRDDRAHPAAAGPDRLGRELHELVQGRRRADHQQLAHLDRPLLVRHPPPARRRLRGDVTGVRPTVVVTRICS